MDAAVIIDTTQGDRKVKTTYNMSRFISYVYAHYVVKFLYVLRVCLGGKAVLWIAYACSVAAITTHLAVEHMECEKALKDLVTQHVYR